MKRFLLLLLVIPSLAFADVSVGVGRDYESFTDAVYSTADSGETIVVYPGEYDIRQEYGKLFGDDVPEAFQHGIFLHDRNVLFLPGSRLVCVWYRNDIFSPIYSGGNVTLDGMDLYAEGMLYAIHDDLWHWQEPYTNVYRNCRITGRYLTNANCIGGGVAKNARIIIENCRFDNGVPGSMTVRYHNTNLPEASGEIWVTDSWFNGRLAFCWYGTSACLNAYVSGCHAEEIEVRPETPDSLVRNVNLYEWNNDY